MTRTITPAEIKPGMTIRWEFRGVASECTVAAVTCANSVGGMHVTAKGGGDVYVWSSAAVTVLAEPQQPEEPTAFGARVVVNGRRFLRDSVGEADEWPWLEEGKSAWSQWSEICSLGPVQVIPDQGWTVPTDAPEIPERIEEWDTWEDVPEGVAVTAPGLLCHYRKNQGMVEFSDPEDNPDWVGTGNYGLSYTPGPWTRATEEPTPEVPERIEEWPEDDEHLREHKWCDRDGYRWTWIVADAQWECRDDITDKKVMTAGIPADGPWVRDTDA